MPLLLLALLSPASHANETGWRYVILHDLSPFDSSLVAPGADIDAIEVVRGGQVIGHAQRVVEARIGEGQHGNRFADPAAALGPADHVSGSGGFVALGANNGFLTLELSVTMRPGDRLRVVEIGASTGGRAEPVEVCVSDRPQGPFTHVGVGHADFTLDLGALPPAPPESKCRAMPLS